MRPFWIVLLAACGHDATEETAQPDLSERVAFAEVEPAERVPVAVLPAQILPDTGAVHDLGPGVEGRLIGWRVTPGDVVSAGDPLAELRSPELSGLESRASELAAIVAEQARTVELRQAAADRGVASAADLREAQGFLASSRAALDAVQSQLRAHRDTTTREGGTWLWRAPADGVVGEIRCALGGVDPSRTCLTLVQPEGVVLEVQVPERHLATLESSVTAQFTAADGRTWSFDEIGRAPSIDPRSRSRSFRFAATGPDGPLQGASGRALLEVEADPELVRIPLAALTRYDAIPAVFVASGELAEPKAVEVVGRDAAGAVVRGLEPDDRVAVRGVYLLKSLALLEEDA